MQSVNKNFKRVYLGIGIALMAGCSGMKTQPVGQAAGSMSCYDRSTEPFTFVVDAHMHSKPFGGAAVPFPELMAYFEQTGVEYANVFGIGQQLPIDSGCRYYAAEGCKTQPVRPTIKNDFENAADYLEYFRYDDEAEQHLQKVHITVAMTFMDLNQPDKAVELIELYDREYPGIFNWAGEVNVVKQAIFENGHEPVTFQQIATWAGFMAKLRERNMPLTVHADLGSDAEPLKYLHLTKYILQS